jgi:hypothetical protein
VLAYTDLSVLCRIAYKAFDPAEGPVAAAMTVTISSEGGAALATAAREVNYFRTLGLHMAVARLLAPEGDHRPWRSRNQRR